MACRPAPAYGSCRLMCVPAVDVACIRAMPQSAATVHGCDRCICSRLSRLNQGGATETVREIVYFRRRRRTTLTKASRSRAACW